MASLVVVLPVEPVTPTTVFAPQPPDCGGQTLQCRERVVDGNQAGLHRVTRQHVPAHHGCQRTRFKAASTKSCPSTRSPANGKKQFARRRACGNRSSSPSATRLRRQSRRFPARNPRCVPSGSFMAFPCGRFEESAPAKPRACSSSRATSKSSNGNDAGAGGLRLLMAFAGDQHDVSGARLGERQADRLAPVGLRGVGACAVCRSPGRASAMIASGSSLRGLSR